MIEPKCRRKVPKLMPKREIPKIDTTFLLLWQYGPRAVIPIDLVARDYFSHLSPENLVRKISAGAIALPLVRIDSSRECAKGVHLLDLAEWIEERAEAARKECWQLSAVR